MAVEVHVVDLALFNVSPDGRVTQKGSGNLTIQETLKFDTEFRVVKSSDNSNTDDNPTIKEYLEREAADDFQPVQVFQTMIITKKVT
jgi:hypothetical protein